MSDTPLAVATYNIHSTVGSDGAPDPARTTRVIAALDVDVAALQEVPLRPSGRGRQPHAVWLERETSMQAIPGPTLTRTGGGFGNVLLTRLDVLRVTLHDLSEPGVEPRGAIEAILRTPAGDPVRIVATHLGLSGGERARQARTLVDRVGATPGDAPTVLLGDLNAWHPGTRAIRILRRTFGDGPRLRTFPARAPLFALDRVLTRSPTRIAHARTVATGEARRASDHLPLTARVERSG